MASRLQEVMQQVSDQLKSLGWSVALEEWVGIDQIGFRKVLERTLGLDAMQDFAEIKLLLAHAFGDDPEERLTHRAAMELIKPAVCFQLVSGGKSPVLATDALPHLVNMYLDLTQSLPSKERAASLAEAHFRAEMRARRGEVPLGAGFHRSLWVVTAWCMNGTSLPPDPVPRLFLAEGGGTAGRTPPAAARRPQQPVAGPPREPMQMGWATREEESEEQRQQHQEGATQSWAGAPVLALRREEGARNKHPVGQSPQVRTGGQGVGGRRASAKGSAPAQQWASRFTAMKAGLERFWATHCSRPFAATAQTASDPGMRPSPWWNAAPLVDIDAWRDREEWRRLQTLAWGGQDMIPQQRFLNCALPLAAFQAVLHDQLHTASHRLEQRRRRETGGARIRQPRSAACLGLPPSEVQELTGGKVLPPSASDASEGPSLSVRTLLPLLSLLAEGSSHPLAAEVARKIVDPTCTGYVSRYRWVKALLQHPSLPLGGARQAKAEHAATALQSATRGLLTRKQVWRLRAQQHREQVAQRAKRIAAEAEHEIQEVSEEAAVRIQAATRGHLARQQHGARQQGHEDGRMEEDDEDDEDRGDQEAEVDEEGAAVRIQAATRGHLARWQHSARQQGREDGRMEEDDEDGET